MDTHYLHINRLLITILTCIVSIMAISSVFCGKAVADAVNSDPQHIGNDSGDRWEPTDPEGITFTWNFNPREKGILNEIRFTGVQDVETDSYLLVDGHVGLFTVNPAQVRLLRGNNNVIFSSEITEEGTVSFNPGLEINPGNYRLEVEAGRVYGWVDDTHDDIDWDQIEVIVTSPTEGGRFNAVEPDTDPVDGPIFTQIAGQNITLDIAALTNQGDGLANNYNGEVTVELIDALDDSGALNPDTGCRSSWGQEVAVNLGTVDFSTTKENPVTETFPAFEEALRETRIRLTGTRGQGGGQTDTACSADAFAIRPDHFTVNATHGDRSSPGTTEPLNATENARSEPVHEAGEHFTIRATARNANGKTTSRYQGTPQADYSGLVLPTEGVNGTFLVQKWFSEGSGTARTNSALFTEVGIFSIDVLDTDFASIDANDGTPIERRRIGPTTIDVGRFVPDHFRITNSTAGSFCNTCFEGAFTYISQPFYYDKAPIITLTAKNAQNNTTQNYDKTFWKFGNQTDYLTSRNYTDQANASAFLEVDLLDNANATDPTDFDGSWNFLLQGNNCYTDSTDGDEFRYQKNGTEHPFEANATLIIDQVDLTDRDGVCYQVNGSCSDYSIENITGTELRYGRLILENAYGSELLNLEVPIRAEYYDNGGFTTNVEDQCTRLTMGNSTEAVKMELKNEAVDWLSANQTIELSGTNSSGTTQGLGLNEVNRNSTTLADGKASLILDAPEAKHTGYVHIQANLENHPWLQYDWSGNGNNTDNPNATATFGIYKGNEHVIYQQETTWK